MKPCEPIQVKLAAGEPLTSQEQTHLKTCQDCNSFAAAVGAITAAAPDLKSLEDARASEVEAVRRQVEHRLRPPRVTSRLAWASAALLLGGATTVMVLSGTFGSLDRERPGERLLTLLDEVSAIARVHDDSGLEEEDEGLYIAVPLLEEEPSGGDAETMFPGSYQLLAEALANSWL